MTALLLFVLAQAPAEVPVAIVVSSRRDVASGAQVVAQLQSALAAQGITALGDKEAVERLSALGGVDPKACDGARLCLQKLAQLLQGVVVGVDVSRAGKLWAGHLEAVAYERVESLVVEDLTSDAKGWKAKSLEVAKTFAARLEPPLKALAEARKPKGAPPPELKGTPALETPKPLALAPEPPPPPPMVAPEAAVQKHGVGPTPYVTTAVGVVAVGAGIVLMVLGFLDRGAYFGSFVTSPDHAGTASTFTDKQLADLAAQSNLRIGLGGGLLGLGLALGVVSGVLFAKE